jgi:DNA-binding protein H-NS
VVDQSEDGDDYEPKKEAIQRTIEFSRHEELTKCEGLDESIKLSMMQVAAPSAAPTSTPGSECGRHHMPISSSTMTRA